MNYNAKGRPATGPHARHGKGQSRPGPGAPVDPDELSRRLYLVLADQKAYAERKKRAAKAEAAAAAAAAKSAAKPPTAAPAADPSVAKAPGSSPPSRGLGFKKSMSFLDRAKRKTSKVELNAYQEEAGPYVPREAATQFALTTTATNIREGGLTHKLSRNALKFHLEADHVDPNTAPSEQTRALRRARSRREQLHERNQFQRTRILEAAAEVEEREHVIHQRHTFPGGFGGTMGATNHERDQKKQRSSVGDLLENFERAERELHGHRQSLNMPPGSPGHREDSPPPRYCLPQEVAEHRVDWTQSDEPKPVQRSKTVPLPILRRPVSIWTLKGRLGTSHSKLSRMDKEPAASGTALESPKPTKIGFFANTIIFFKHAGS